MNGWKLIPKTIQYQIIERNSIHGIYHNVIRNPSIAKSSLKQMNNESEKRTKMGKP
jgi:hypothetical protein